MTFSEIVGKVDSFAWGPWLLILLVGTGIYYTCRMKFVQFSKFGYAMKNTLGKMFKKSEAGKGEVTPLQAVTTALAATVGTGNIAGVTGAIVVGGPGAVFWMWISALFGMATKYSEVVLAVRYRERNAAGDWVGGPMYYIKNGLGKNWKWLGAVFSALGALACFGIGNVTQVHSICDAVDNAIATVGKNVTLSTVSIFDSDVTVSSLIIGAVVMVIVALVLFGGIKRIGTVTEYLVPVMAVVYIVGSLIVLVSNGKYIGQALSLVFSSCFTGKAVLGGTAGFAFKTIVQKGVGRGVFSNEAGLGSAPMAHAATSETNPVKQGLYGIFEVFMDTIVICTMTALVLLTSACQGGIIVDWGNADISGAVLIADAFGSVLGDNVGSIIVAVGLSLFALSTVLSWSLYGTRCFEYLFGYKASKVYQIVFIAVIFFGVTLGTATVWNIADALNGFMAIPNLVALLALSPVVIKLTKEHFSAKETL